MSPVEQFTRMDRSTAEQWADIRAASKPYQTAAADRVLAMLGELAGVTNGFLTDQLTHCLQTATMAERDGADPEMILAALLHDVGKVVQIPNHGEIAAAIIRPYVRDDVYQVVRTHQDFQGVHYYHHTGGDRHARRQYEGTSWYSLAARFADDWDQAAFDPDYDTLPLEHFEPLVRRLMAHPRS